MMKTDDLIDQLGRRVTPAPPLLAPRWRTAVWLVWSALYMVVVAIAMFVVTSTAAITLSPLYLLQQGAAAVTAMTAARAAFGSVIPGVAARLWTPSLVSAGVWVALLLWNAMLDVRVAGTFGIGSQTDWPCVASMAMGGIVLGGPLVWMLRRGAPLTPRSTAFLAGMAALSIANIEACLTRPHTFASTVLLWHGVTVVVVAGVFALFGRRWLRWRTLMPQ
jgi:hypothetical protein